MGTLANFINLLNSINVYPCNSKSRYPNSKYGFKTMIVYHSSPKVLTKRPNKLTDNQNISNKVVIVNLNLDILNLI